jgi:phage repressor protein C with HTH and peptisase S24 domain
MDNPPHSANRSGWGQRIRALRRALGLNQSQFAVQMGTGQSSVSRWENEQDEPLPHNWERMAELGGSSPAALRYGEPPRPPPPELAEAPARYDPGPAAADGFIPKLVDIPTPGLLPRNLPVYGAAIGGEDGAFEMNGQVHEYAARPQDLLTVTNAYGVYVQGESMYPRFEPGWLLHVNPNQPVRRGDTVVIQVRDPDPFRPPQAFVKVFKARTPDRLVVSQFNPPADLDWPLADVISVHRVIGVAGM